ncbi:MAG: hypothetical protein KAI66_22775 [Lentisphaeria bacterium]|nr:hypothetical protein [Lentisphaeria bacterium]
MSIPPRQQILGALTALLALFFLVDHFALTPLLNKYRGQCRDIQKLEELLIQEHSLVKHRENWERRVQTFRDHALPTNPSEAENTVLRALRDWADQSHLAVESVRPRWQQEKDGPQILEVRLSGLGDLEEITQFLLAVEVAKIPIRVVKADLSAMRANPRNIALNLLVQAVLIPPEKSEESGGGTL